MTIEAPIWLQAETYPARVDRGVIDAAFHEGVVLSGLAVSQRGAGANNSVDVAVGFGVVAGDDQANQGKYLVHVTGVENVALTAAPGSNSRIDLVVLQVRDPNAGGTAGDDAVIEIVTGVAGAVPVAPAVPDSALVLAQVLRTNGDTSITNGMITDRRADALPNITRRLTTTQRDALTGLTAGYTIYNTTTAQGEIYNGAIWDPFVAAPPSVDVQVFTANGTWTKPAGATLVQIHLFGGGGGGGGGSGAAAGNSRFGGGGGGGGAHVRRTIIAGVLGATVGATVAAGGVSGAGGTNTGGSHGGDGGFSSFGNFFAYGGAGGSGAIGAAGPGGGGGGSVTGGGAFQTAGEPIQAASGNNLGEGGASGAVTGGATQGSSSEFGGAGGGCGSSGAATGGLGGSSVMGGTGGGGGGGLNSANVAVAAGQGGHWRGYKTAGVAGAAAGTGTGGNPGIAGTANGEPMGGGGGGGGAPNTAGTGGAGGSGAIRGGAGGGGGGGTNVGGAGGVGGRGEVIVITFF